MTGPPLVVRRHRVAFTWFGDGAPSARWWWQCRLCHSAVRGHATHAAALDDALGHLDVWHTSGRRGLSVVP